MKKLNKIYIAFTLLVFAMAIGVVQLQPESGYELLSNPVSWLVLLCAFFLLISFIAVFKAMDSMRWMIQQKDGKVEEEEEESDDDDEDFLSSIWKKMQDARPIEEEAEIELDHNYDGIRELDNNLPPWWLWGFYLSILFAVIYLVRYHITGSAPLQAEEYRIEMAEAEKAKAEYLRNAANLVDETNAFVVTDEAKIKEGAKLFNSNCVVCHAADGGGGIGPNLTDEYWLYGGDVKDLFSTIKYGTSKGMTKWKDLLTPSQIQNVASFVLNLQGTTPLDPKEAQGELYIPEMDAPADSLNPVDSANTETDSINLP